MSSAEQLIKLLDYNLVNQKFDNAKKLLDDEEQYGKVILSNYSDVIQEVVLKHLTAANYQSQPLIYEACEYILNLFAKKCHQQGILFEFLELIESVKDDDVFRSILKALQVILLNQSESKSRSLEYTLNSIEDYIQELELPKLFTKKYLEEEEEKLLENDEKVRRILMNYMTLDLFYKPILVQVVENSSDVSNIFRSTKYNRRNVIFCFILRLLGKPLSHLDLSYDPNSQNVKTYSREVAENIVASLYKLYVNVYDLLNYVELQCRWPAKDKIDDDMTNIFLHPEKFPLLEVGILFYLIIGEGICYESVPKVNDPKYILNIGLYLVNEILSANEPIIPKGLKLCKKMLMNINEFFKADELDDDIFMDFCNSLIKTIIYSPSKPNRKAGLEVLRMYILKFDTAGRFLLIKNVMKTSTHKGLIGYLTTLYKDIIFENIDCEVLSKHLSGFNFKQLLFNHICKLENGVQCDLTDSSDQIIAALNFLVGLILRDKENKTGIKDHVKSLQSGFLSDLRYALDFSRAHFKEEYERVKSGAVDDQKTNSLDVQILNDEAGLDEITKERKLEMLNSALMMFDLIDFQLARVTETIDRKLKRHKFLTACFVEVNSNDLCIPQSHICARQLSIPSLALCSDKKIDDFRAREEEKEADFNKQPIEKEEKASKEESTNQEDEKVTEIKNKILEASLEFVSTAGWTRQAIVKGAEKAGYPGTIHGMFPKGGIELINYFYLKCNKQLVETMKEKVAGIEKVEDPKQFVTWAIKERLIMIKPFISNWPQALAIMTLPPNVPTSLANMLTLVDDICYYSGDRSVDFNWYARRIGLATIYKATELYILQDSTPDNEATWKFLERRIADASLVHDVLIQSESATQHLSQAVTSAFTTARNILGLNFERR